MEKIHLAVALLRNQTKDGVRWLARWNDCRKNLEFILGDRLEGERFRETIVREVAWELGLDREQDMLVSNMAQLNMQFVDQLPNRYSPADVTVAFYNVLPYGQAALDHINADAFNVWVTSEEICAGVTNSGRPFDPMVTYLVERSEVIRSWESSI